MIWRLWKTEVRWKFEVNRGRPRSRNRAIGGSPLDGRSFTTPESWIPSGAVP